MNLIYLYLFAVTYGLNTCIRKSFRGPEPAMVCVCNATYCDEFPPVGILHSNEIALYTSSIGWKRFDRTTLNFQDGQISNSSEIVFRVLPNLKFQQIFGFGATFTDAVGMILNNLDNKTKQKLIEAYFGSQGIGFSTARVPMASTGCSNRSYSYCETKNDFGLITFNLTQEDFNLKIPYINAAKDLIGDQLKIFASPWSAPAWMKTNDDMKSGGQIKGDTDGPYYQTYGKYFLRFFEEYAKQGVHFWGLTLQNEPSIGLVTGYNSQSMFFSAEMERDFIHLWLGPTLRASPVTKDVKIMIVDDMRYSLPEFPNTVLADPIAAQYVDGIAVHWYVDMLQNGSVLSQTHDLHPEKFILYTEAANGMFPFTGQGVSLGDWSRAESYNFHNWVIGWNDYNFCVHEDGGPNQNVDAPIVVNKTTNEFYKQPMFYALGHFSKLIPRNSYHISSTFEDVAENMYLEGVAFLTPNNERVTVLMNRHATNTYRVKIEDETMKDKFFLVVLEPHSFVTAIWNVTTDF